MIRFLTVVIAAFASVDQPYTFLDGPSFFSAHHRNTEAPNLENNQEIKDSQDLSPSCRYYEDGLPFLPSKNIRDSKGNNYNVF